ncbi:Glu-tRNA(Gln) amidotransferase subunit GatD [Candidatus Woesearchaeota archaeon]|nr:Glu-tRNA(Gln) amidotransferase subunit GatD [Candidatus Woesearchaeota archaeon]
MKKNITINTKIKIITKDARTFEGLVLPDTTNQKVVLKLSSGYNIGILSKNIKETKTLKKQITKKTKLPKLKTNKNLPTISILHTGGTIASKVDYETGAVLSQFSPEDIVSMFPEIKSLANIDSKLVRNMWSSNMNFNHFNLLAKAVEKEVKKGVKGIIVTLGTDALTYASAALSFILEGIEIPVIFTASQRSSDRGSSDAFLNLYCAVKFAKEANFAGVAICMHGSSEDDYCNVLPACKTKKLHSSRRNTFQPINTTPIAKVTTENIEFFPETHHKKRNNSKLKLKLLNPKLKLGILRFHPHFQSSMLEPVKKFDGLIIEGTGLGNGPVECVDEFTKENEKTIKTITSLTKEIPVTMTTQCVFGRVNMNVYSYGRKILDSGVWGNHTDMLPETAFIKLAWLLSNYNKKDIKELYHENLRGEISERTLYND